MPKGVFFVYEVLPRNLALLTSTMYDGIIISHH